MEYNDLIQVLWVEDDPVVTETFPIKAENFNLQLVPFSNWDDGKKALESDYDRWSAIILDAKCKQHRDSSDNAVKFLGEALKDIAVIGKEKGRIIPWYILTGGDESEVSDSITDDRMEWDSDWTKAYNKKYYSKNVDNEMLFRRIRYHANISPRYQILTMYRDVYEQLKQLNIDVREDIITILEAIHFPNAHMDFNPRYFYNPLRQALECIFRNFGKVNIIPEVFFSGDKVNLNQCFMFLIGKDAEKMGYKHCDGGITPRHIQEMMSLIISLGNAHSHSAYTNHTTKLTEKETQNYDSYITSVGDSSKLLVFSITLQFCEILLWANNYIKTHSDKEENRNKWMQIDMVDDIKEANRDIVGMVEKGTDGVYHIENKYMLSKKLIESKKLMSKTIKIIRMTDNKNEDTRDNYPYFVCKFDIID